jgi:outer membrane receptor protein involved in Fe transport
MTWEPAPGLRFNFAGGYEATRLNNGDRAIDLIDRADIANHPDWMELRPYPTQSSDCIMPKYVVAAILQNPNAGNAGVALATACGLAYNGSNLDPVTQLPYVANPTVTGRTSLPIPAGYPGFDPISQTAANNGSGPAPNLGEGFFKDLSGNELPNAPPFTISAGAQYTLPLSSDWAGTLRADYYWQDYSWARVFNDDPYDRIRGYTNVNLTLILTSQNGWQVMLYDKNVFNQTAITGTFLNSDDSGLTTNLFLTDPKLIGIRVTKNW